MDVWIVVICALVLISIESEQTPTSKHTTVPPPDLTSRNDTQVCSCCPSVAVTTPPLPPSSSDPGSPAPDLGLLTVQWDSKSCTGDIHLSFLRSNASLHICFDDSEDVRRALRQVCEHTEGCVGKPQWKEGDITWTGHHANEGGKHKSTTCPKLRVRCKVKPSRVSDVQGELKGYKVATALLCCLLVVLCLISFTRPTVRALQKRLSDKRQTRWIGPTQSHSVSYHRGKSTVKNADGDKRSSYPALEGLISGSRDPPSNRNSDYNY
ncbi:uncharacterized protein LOC117527070 [Thalassophryne amazonica]|uniref:uncharacterized protein LOC117527070 n=1 Tax=Thalassophryne amazonica TaxID=390379 RepID=UPI001470FD98|nr:uncharacterized protein LOC117527070 [Thalassophryne amazonica]